jgi:hypothetical protein
MSTWKFMWHRDVTPVYSMMPSTEPDPNWEYTDTAGCQHRGDKLRETTVVVQDESDWFDDGDGYVDEVTNHHTECKTCGEHIAPGRRTLSQTQYIPGRVTVKAVSPDGREVYLTDEQYTLYRLSKLTELIETLEN